MTISVSRLPAEVLLTIFSFVHDDYKTLLCITHTCAYWREVLISDSEAWARIDCNSLPKNLAQLFAERSSCRPLEFNYTMSYHDPPFVTEHLWPYHLWRRQMNRVQRLVLAIHPQSATGVPPITTWLTSSHIPLLEEVELSLVEPPYSPIREDYVCSNIRVQLPKLRSLSLSGVRFPWSSGIYTRLTKLHIQLWGTFDLPNAIGESILSIFHDQPVLEDLLLHVKCIMNSNPSPFANGPFLELPALKKAHLALTPQDMTYVLSAISLPEELNWLSLTSISWPLLDIARCLPSDPRCLANLKDVNVCKVLWEDGEVEFGKARGGMHDDEPSYVARLDIADASMDYIDAIFSAVDKVREIHGPERLSSFVLVDLPDHSASRVLEKSILPSVKRLDVVRCKADILELLGRTLEDGNHALEVVRLSSMSISAESVEHFCKEVHDRVQEFAIVDCEMLCESESAARQVLQDAQRLLRTTRFERVSFLTPEMTSSTRLELE